uniref:TRAF-type domain-containing protein n=1 Tax=Oryza glumipatula TaxID=40148 RepID=A0A0D9YUN6_9ORYZ
MENLECTVGKDGLNFQCNLCDSDVVHSMAEILLRGLATASVDSTTGDIFKSPSSVAVGMKSELAEYLIQRSMTFVREAVDGGEDHSEQLIKASTMPTEFLSDLIDGFVASKRNFLSHVSGFLSSETRLNKIKDFIQKLEMENFWTPDVREATAGTILKSIDMKCIIHCPERFDTQDKLAEHRNLCRFRIVNCKNDGCLASFSANHIEKHDSVCPFKVLPCEQLCEQHVMRCEMDRHCASVCPMKLINCPFYQVGCESAFPQCVLDKHCSERLQIHLMYILELTTRHDAFVNDMNQRLHLLEKAQSLNELSGALDNRTLTLTAKEQEAKIKKLEQDLKVQETKLKKLESEFKSGKEQCKTANVTLEKLADAARAR